MPLCPAVAPPASRKTRPEGSSAQTLIIKPIFRCLGPDGTHSVRVHTNHMSQSTPLTLSLAPLLLLGLRSLAACCFCCFFFLAAVTHTLAAAAALVLLLFCCCFNFDVFAAAFRFCCSRHTPLTPNATAATQILKCVCCLLLLLCCLPPPPPPPLLPCC